MCSSHSPVFPSRWKDVTKVLFQFNLNKIQKLLPEQQAATVFFLRERPGLS